MPRAAGNSRTEGESLSVVNINHNVWNNVWATLFEAEAGSHETTVALLQQQGGANVERLVMLRCSKVVEQQQQPASSGSNSSNHFTLSDITRLKQQTIAQAAACGPIDMIRIIEKQQQRRRPAQAPRPTWSIA